MAKKQTTRPKRTAADSQLDRVERLSEDMRRRRESQPAGLEPPVRDS